MTHCTRSDLIEMFQVAHLPLQELSVHEFMIGFKEFLSWIRYLPKKTTKWGMNNFVLAETASGYIYLEMAPLQW